MPRGNWREFAKVGLVVGITTLTLCAAMVAWGLLETAKYQREADHNARHYAEYTGKKVRYACVQPTPVEKADCIEEARKEDREYQRDEQDLVAQRQSALWAYVMAVAAVVGMGLSAVGVFLVWTTFRETRKAAETSRETYDAFINLERARVITYGGGILWNPPHITAVTIGLNNVGRSTAAIISAHYDFMESASYPGNFGTVMSLDSVLGSAEDTSFTIHAPKSDTFKTHPYIGGYVIYRTAFGLPYRAYFMAKLLFIPHDSEKFYSQQSGWILDREANYSREKREAKFCWPADD